MDRKRRLYDRGQRGWPGFALAFEDFRELVGPQIDKLDGLDEEQICADDLFLVAACLARLPGAVDRFDAHVWPQLERHLRRMEPQPERLAEMRQALLVRLFVPGSAGAPARIAGYTGRGPLLVWLRMAAARMALNARRDEKRTRSLSDSDVDHPAAVGLDMELSFIRGRYEADFAQALRAAMADLTDEQRLLLRFRYRDELTSTQIGALLKTSRVTAHRRVAAARDALAEKLRDRLRNRLELNESGLAHLLGLLSSRLVPALTAELRAGLS